MGNLAQQLLHQLAGGALSSVSGRIGADEKTTGSALETIVPLLITALAKNSSRPEGAAALHRAIEKDHDGTVLDNLKGFLENPQAADGAGILRHVLGGRQPAVTDALSKGTNLDGNQIGQLLQIAAPLVMGMLARQQKGGGLDSNALSALLGGQTRTARESGPDISSVLSSLLDSDGDGISAGDVIGTLGKLLGGR